MGVRAKEAGLSPRDGLTISLATPCAAAAAVPSNTEKYMPDYFQVILPRKSRVRRGVN